MANADPILLTISNKPRAIVQTMDNLTKQYQARTTSANRRASIPLFLLFLGVAFFLLDLFLGYGAFYFSAVCAGLWITALILFIATRRASPGKAAFPPHFATVRQVIQTLRDDLAPKQNLLGKLDLTGARQPSKLARSGTGLHNSKLNYYRDEWLNLKAKLYDGNILRVSAIERVKVKEGMFRRGRSGKMKWKPEQVENGQQIKVRLAVNPAVYEIMHHVQLSTKVGQYFIDGFSANDGVIELTAASVSKEIKPEDILGILKFAYDQLERKGQP